MGAVKRPQKRQISNNYAEPREGCMSHIWRAKTNNFVSLLPETDEIINLLDFWKPIDQQILAAAETALSFI